MVIEITRSPHLAAKCQHVLSNSQETTYKKLSSIEMISMFVESNLSKREYEIIRYSFKIIYLSYTPQQIGGKNCYPNK